MCENPLTSKFIRNLWGSVLKMKGKSKLTYTKSGVDYSKIDPLKVMAQKAAKKTAKNLAPFKEITQSRGESAHVFEVGDFYIASITECLGTKSLVADEVRKITGKTYYDRIAQDTIAMAVNDIITVGARPLTIHAYWAAGGSDWFSDEKKMHDLVTGWKKACGIAGAVWAGGETPSLSGIIERGAIDLAASCVGIVEPKSRLTLGKKLKEGDAIVLFESSGIHANGVTLARALAHKLDKGYRSDIEGTIYGEALLSPTIIYSQVTEALFKEGVNIHYMSNITGHGWRKIMRHPSSFTYRITQIPPAPPVLRFIVRKAGIGMKDAYGTFNMGAGFAVFVAGEDALKVAKIAGKKGLKAYVCGVVSRGEKRIVIEPLGITFEGETLKVRA
jgi:phosphoribosylformylglycinamidine cyclo-ligase